MIETTSIQVIGRFVRMDYVLGMLGGDCLLLVCRFGNANVDHWIDWEKASERDRHGMIAGLRHCR